MEKAETEYTANADGTRSSNIPFENYIKEISKPENAVVPDIRKNFSGEDSVKYK